MLGFGSTQAAGLSQLIAKKRFPKAIEVLREQLKSRGRDPRLRRQLADVLVMAGRTKEAAPILLELAEDLALAGAAGKAIAVLKRAQRLEPGQPEVEEQLAYLIAQEKAPSPDPWARAKGTTEPPPPKYDDPPAAAAPFLGDLEEIPAEPEAPSPPPPPPADETPVAAPPRPAEEDLPLPAPPSRHEASSDLLLPSAAGPGPEPDTGPSRGAGAAGPTPSPEPEEFPLPEDDGPELDDDAFRDEVLGLIEDVLSGRAKADSASMTSLPAVQSPLFPDFSAGELIEVIRGLELRAYEPGEIVVAEGQPGQSLFVVTSGSVRTYVRDREGGNAPVRVLGEGDFFGEVSLLEGSPRTATVTAASPCELLEIDRLTLGHIARKHPRVWNVVRTFYEQRARSDAETAARGASSRPPGDGA